MLFVLILMLQLATPEELLYRKIGDERDPNTRLKLLQQFEQTYPTSTKMAEICEMTMDVYRILNNLSKMVQYGERAIALEPENLQALTVVARQYSIEGRNFDKALAYAQRALASVKKRKQEAKPKTVRQEEWQSYLQSISAAAEGTIRYVKGTSKQATLRRAARTPGAPGAGAAR